MARASGRRPRRAGPRGRGAGRLPHPGRRALGRRLQRPRSGSPGAGGARRLHDDGRLARDAHHVARTPSSGWSRRGPARRRSTARCAARPGKGSAMVHEIGAPHISPDRRLRAHRELRGSSRCPRWSATGASWVASTARRELGCVGAAGDLCADGASGPYRAMTTPYADAQTSGHLYLDRRTGPRPRGRLHPSRAAGRLPRDRRPGLAAVVDGFRQAADMLGGSALAGPGTGSSTWRWSVPRTPALAELGVTASMQPMFDGTGAATTRCTPAARRRSGPADEPVRLAEPRRCRARLRVRLAGDVVRPVGSGPGRGVSTTPSPNASRSAPPSTRTPGAGGVRRAVTRVA